MNNQIGFERSEIMKNFIAENLWALESTQLRFLQLGAKIFINDFGLLSEERRAHWIKWLADKYPSKVIIFV